MSLEGLFPLLSRSAGYREISALLRQGEARARAILIESALPYWMAVLRGELHIPVLVVTARPERARRVYEDLLVWCGDESGVYALPEGEMLQSPASTVATMV